MNQFLELLPPFTEIYFLSVLLYSYLIKYHLTNYCRNKCKYVECRAYGVNSLPYNIQFNFIYRENFAVNVMNMNIVSPQFNENTGSHL